MFFRGWSKEPEGTRLNPSSAFLKKQSEIIITLGHSRTIEAFLKHAAKDKKFTVIIAETAPSLSGHTLAASLAAHNPPIPTLLIPDSNIYAFIPRCTKLLLPCSIILSTGGIFAPSGSLLAAKAAQAHSVQVVVCAGQYKLTPSWNLYQEFGAGDFGDPGEVLEFGELGKWGDEVEVLNPRFDYVGPELVDVFLTDQFVFFSFLFFSMCLYRSSTFLIQFRVDSQWRPRSFLHLSVCSLSTSLFRPVLI